jgi:hypothetical protein
MTSHTWPAVPSYTVSLPCLIKPGGKGQAATHFSTMAFLFLSWLFPNHSHFLLKQRYMYEKKKTTHWFRDKTRTASHMKQKNKPSGSLHPWTWNTDAPPRLGSKFKNYNSWFYRLATLTQATYTLLIKKFRAENCNSQLIHKTCEMSGSHGGEYED